MYNCFVWRKDTHELNSNKTNVQICWIILLVDYRNKYFCSVQVNPCTGKQIEVVQCLYRML